MSEERHYLLTGATGLLGFQILHSALHRGYRVRCTVRSPAQASTLRAKPSISTPNTSKLITFATVADMTLSDAYDTALDSITHVVHCACPLPNPTFDQDHELDLFIPSVFGTSNILEAATRSSTVRSLVFTNSISANLIYPPSPGQHITPYDRIPVPQPPFPSPELAYQAGKAAVLELTDKFAVERKPKFGIATVFPGYIFGRDHAATTVNELKRASNALLLMLLQGEELERPRLSGAVLLEDLAEVHLEAAEQGTREECSAAMVGHRCFGASVSVAQDEAFGIVEKEFSHAVKEGIFRNGRQECLGERWDSDKTEELLGVKLNGLDEMVRQVAGQYLELLHNGRGRT
ncbi:MAG: hypothetical protein MMC23_004291 [Stictis urceolatum]|nr:hypothetical protein [Stictis urceolata]